MKKIYSFIFAIMAMFVIVPMTVSCGDDNKDGETADTAALVAELAECQSLISSATTADWTQDAIDEFQKVIDAVVSGLANNPTQTAVNNMLVQLQEARAKFESSKLGAISSANLLLSYDFETEDDPQVSAGTLKYKAAFAKGPSEIFGTDTQNPTFVTGVGGKGKAISFDKGSHLEIADYAYNSLLTKDFTLSVWVKPDEMVEGNYVFSVNYWNGCKLNIPAHGKPFFTFASASGTADCDNETDESVKQGEWAHVVCVLSFTDHTLKFYVNGTLTKTWDASGKPALEASGWATEYSSTVGKLPIMIGTSTSYAEAAAAWTWEWAKTAENWEASNSFNGAIDNLQVYDIALTDGQVSSLYNSQK